jgi:hypothetical protein
MIALLSFHVKCELRQQYDADNNQRQHQGGGLDPQNNNNHENDRNEFDPDNHDNRNPPMNPMGNWQNALPDDISEHPVVLAFLDSNASFLVSDPHLPGNPIIYASPVSTDRPETK